MTGENPPVTGHNGAAGGSGTPRRRGAPAASDLARWYTDEIHQFRERLGQLPGCRLDTVLLAARVAGWRFTDLGQLLGLTPGRVAQRVNRAANVPSASPIAVPAPPRPAFFHPRTRVHPHPEGTEDRDQQRRLRIAVTLSPRDFADLARKMRLFEAAGRKGWQPPSPGPLPIIHLVIAQVLNLGGGEVVPDEGSGPGRGAAA